MTTVFNPSVNISIEYGMVGQIWPASLVFGICAVVEEIRTMPVCSHELCQFKVTVSRMWASLGYLSHFYINTPEGSLILSS